ncbi:MAG: phosphate ABC transporter permease subunit PstC [Desulfuromonas sp.]|nr:MAG: phosphate ABC transporter permease subunit PstC [Desulfuromonas sp.]
MLKQKNNMFDPLFRWTTLGGSLVVLVLVAGILLTLINGALPSLEKFGVGFLFSQEWNPAINEYGALSSVYGTLVSTLIAMLIAVPLSLVIALFLVELAPPGISRVVGGAIELLAAIPSIIYGMWGLFVFAPFLADHVQPKLAAIAPGLPFFTGPPMGIGMLSAGIILALMILPFITSVTRDVFQMVPSVVKESAYGMGSTTWEVTRKVTVPYGIQGVVGACFLGLGRAIGETMAVTFVIGNSHEISASLFSAANSIASTLANEFTEAADDVYLAALIELGLVLFGVTLVLQIIARWWLRRTAKKMGAVR